MFIVLLAVFYCMLRYFILLSLFTAIANSLLHSHEPGLAWSRP